MKPIMGLIIALCAVGCASGANDNAAATRSAASSRSTSWPEESKRWRYPREDAVSLTHQGSGRFVLYQASTNDSFSDVCRYYEAAGGVQGLGDFSASPGWVENGTGPEITVVAVQAGEGYAKAPDQQSPNDRSFLIRKPGYAVTAFLRQEPPGTKTRITLIFESDR